MNFADLIVKPCCTGELITSVVGSIFTPNLSLNQRMTGDHFFI